MANIEIDRTDAGLITVSVQSGAKPAKLHTFATRPEAEAFAYGRMGRGCVISTLDMTPAQLTEHRARQARIAVFLMETDRALAVLRTLRQEG